MAVIKNPVRIFNTLLLTTFAFVQSYRSSNPECPFESPSTRREGGYPGVSKESCESLGNCYDDTILTPGVKHCFKPRRTNNPECHFDSPETRDDGGWPGISKSTCESLGNCFDDTVRTEGVNWCFLKKYRKTKRPDCVFDLSQRLEDKYLSQSVCEFHGYCFDNTILGVALCYKPKFNFTYLESRRVVGGKSDWGHWDYCPPNGYVASVDVKVFRYMDDNKRMQTPITGVKMYCQQIGEDLGLSPISSLRGNQGDYFGINHCYGPITGFQTQVAQISDNKIGITDFKWLCAGASKEIGSIDTSPEGYWTKQQSCPVRRAICGLRTQMSNVKLESGHVQAYAKVKAYRFCLRSENKGAPEHPWVALHPFHQYLKTGTGRGKRSQKVLTNIDLVCCPVLNPAEICKPEQEWVALSSCKGLLSCKLAFETSARIEFVKDRENSWDEEVYKKVGYSIKNILPALSTNFQRTFNSNGKVSKDFSRIFATMALPETAINIDLKDCDSGVEVLELSCGIFRVMTMEYRCAQAQ